jgi:Protein of unknown function (DUF1648)
MARHSFHGYEEHGMSRYWYKLLVALMWLALPTSAMEYRQAWSQLPARMAVHFDADWRPNGYTSREGALMLGLGIIGFMLVVSTIATLIAHALKASAAWPLLAVFYLTLAFVWYGNHSIIEFNRNAEPAHSELVGNQGSPLSVLRRVSSEGERELRTEN